MLKVLIWLANLANFFNLTNDSECKLWSEDHAYSIIILRLDVTSETTWC